MLNGLYASKKVTYSHKDHLLWIFIDDISPGAEGSNPTLRVKVFFLADSCRLGIGLPFSGVLPPVILEKLFVLTLLS